jgi:hypothetical protein
MANFVRKHCYKFVNGVIFNERIEQDNFLFLADAGKESVRFV